MFFLASYILQKIKQIVKKEKKLSAEGATQLLQKRDMV